MARTENSITNLYGTNMNHNIYTLSALPPQLWNYLGKKDLSDIFTDFPPFIQINGNTNINNLEFMEIVL